MRGINVGVTVLWGESGRPDVSVWTDTVWLKQTAERQTSIALASLVGLLRWLVCFAGWFALLVGSRCAGKVKGWRGRVG